MKRVNGLLENAERQRIFGELAPHWANLWEYGLKTGLRVSDALTLTVKQLTQTQFTVREMKTGAKRKIRLPKRLKEKLMKERLGSVYVWESPKGNMPLSRQAAWKAIKKAAKAAGIAAKIGTHTMRKCFALDTWKATGNLEKVQERLGHKYLSTTTMYLLELLR